MRLAKFIDENVDKIVTAAAAFARSFPAGARLDDAGLQNHIGLILDAIAKDLRTEQSAASEIRKAHGELEPPPEAAATAAQTHALLRAKGGFSIEQLMAEYRALRASVLRLWVNDGTQLDAHALADIVRFGEAIDQAVAESTAHFVAEADRLRNVFLAVLGHDLRGPLNAILMTSELLARVVSDEPLRDHTARLMRSGERMRRLLDDLLDYSRASLGVGINVKREAVDLSAALREEIDILRSALPSHAILFETEGATQGSFDASRLREAVSNLVSNAATYGERDHPIVVRLIGHDDVIRLSVENAGETLTQEELSDLFEPLARGREEPAASTAHTHLGLGLFIVRAVTRAHGGEVSTESANRKTRFTLHLPCTVG
jgi:signal transduction histidine kinase